MRSLWVYAEVLVPIVLTSIGLVDWRFFHMLGAWYPFIASYVLSRITIFIIADILKVRLFVPINREAAKRSMTVGNLGITEQLVQAQDFAGMGYRRLRQISKEPNRLASMSNETFKAFAVTYAYMVQKTIVHIHHFVLGIVLMPFTWILYFYEVPLNTVFLGLVSSGMLIAGVTLALFMSEFYQLLTQQWGP